MSTTIIDKVRKLRALAESTNVNEAAAAAAAAERLIQEHNLSEAEVSVDPNAESERVERDATTEMGATLETWRNNLLAYLTAAYQCAGFYRVVRKAFGERGHVFLAYGRKADLDTLRYQYAFFTAEITRLAEARGKGRGRTFRNSFRLGAVHAIGEALAAARTEARNHATGSALVVVDRRAELAREKRAEDAPNLRSTGKRASRLDRDGYEAGKRAGAGIQQRSQIAASGVRLLGGK